MTTSKPAIHFLAIVLMLCCFACGKAPADKSQSADDNHVVVLHPHQQLPDGLDVNDYTTVFLAGTIDMGASIDWQAQSVEYFEQIGGKFLLFNPRQEHWDPNREGEMDYQVNWELDHMEQADIIIMNFLPESKSPITLLEMGLHARSGKLLVCCPEEFYRYDNVRITCRKYGIPLYHDFVAMLNAINAK